MPTRDFPTSYTAAAAMLGMSQWTELTKDGALTLRRRRDGVAVFVEEEANDLVTFYTDGRVKLCTLGRNTQLNIGRIAACLPPGYFIRKQGSELQLGWGERAKHLHLKPIARFLASTIFHPRELSARRAGTGGAA